ncbi:Scr1 family TA system antitoxin-like transcriptional regulator [Streptomyces sp. NPDC017056]|uniref:Scr1 family TA system antitoxin-like transcriptional regulator n=1 Tax=Streptomyces sp. NPDC017056 TaxID=3364973 RepID=UPI0037B44867
MPCTVAVTVAVPPERVDGCPSNLTPPLDPGPEPVGAALAPWAPERAATPVTPSSTSHDAGPIGQGEGLTSALYIEEPDKVAAHRDAWQRLTSAALPVGASADLITEIRKNT